MVKARIPFLFSFLLVVAPPSFAQTTQATESEQLKAELEALRLDFANRIAALEARLRAVESASPSTAAPPAAPSEPAVATPPPAPAAAPASSSKFFNPDIAAIGDFVAAA